MNPYAPPDGRPTAQHHHRHHHHHHHQQQSRYAQVSSSPRPPNRSNYSDNPNLYPPQTVPHYHHHHQHHQQSRNFPPQIHHPSDYHPSPAPPRALTTSLPRYELATRGFNPIDDDRDRRSIYHHHQHHHHALVDSDRRVLGGHDSPFVENRAELLDRRLVHRSYSNADYNHDVHRRAPEHRAASPYGPVDSSRREVEPISRVRLRENYAEGSGSDQQDSLFHGSSYRFSSVAGSYDSEPHRNERGDGTSGRQSWVHKRDNTRNSSESLPEITDFDGEDFRTVALKQEYHAAEFGRYGGASRGSREVVREHSLTPKKQLQKKSAFLRLQMPRFNHRIRDNERHYSNGYNDDSGSGPGSSKSKGQGQFISSDHGPRDTREDGSVDLDVSFKSNTLIAKPIVQPTSPRVVYEKDYMPSSKKLKSAIVSDKDSTSSLLDKLNVYDEKLNSSLSVTGVAISTTENSKQLLERVGASAQHQDNLGHLEGIVAESDAPVKSNSSSLPVSKVTNVSSVTYEVGKSCPSPVADIGSSDLQGRKDAVAVGQDSKVGATRDVVLDRAENVGSTQGKTADKGLPGKAPSVKDAVPEGQNSNAGPKSNVASDKAGKNVRSRQGKTVGRGLPGKAHSFRDAVPEGQDSSAGAKRDVTSGKAGENVGTSQGKTIKKGLPGKAHSSKDAVPEEQHSGAGAKRDVVSDKAGKSGGSSLSKTVDKGLPDKAPSVKDTVSKGQDSAAGAKRDVVSDKAGKTGGPSLSKNADKGLLDKAPSVKDTVSKGQGSGAGAKRDVVSDNAGKTGGSSLSKTAVKELPDKAPSVKGTVPKGRYSGAGAKRVVVSDNAGKAGGSSLSKTADKGLPDKAPSVRVAKKKKIVKKVVKKVVTRKADPPNRQPSRKHDGLKKADSPSRLVSSKGSGSLQEEIASHSMALSEECLATNDSNEPGLLRQIDEKKGLSCSFSSPRFGRETDEGTGVLCENKERDCSSSSFCPVNCEETKVDAPNANNVDLQIVSSSMNVPVAVVDGKISKDEFSGQLHQDVKFLLLDNEAEKDNLAEDCSTTRMSTLSGSNIEDGSTVVDGSLLMRNAASGPEEDLIGSQDLPIIGKEKFDAPDCSLNTYQMTTGLCGDSQNVMETGACWVSGSFTTNSEKNFMGLSNLICDDARGQLPQVSGPRMLDNGSKANLGNFDLTVDNSKDSALNAGRSHRGIFQVDPLTSREASICIKPVSKTYSGPSDTLDTVLNLCTQNPDPAVASSLGELTVGLPAITFGHNVSHGTGSADAHDPLDTKVSLDSDSGLDEGRTSPTLRKRRKVCSAYSGSSDAMAPQDNNIALVADTTTTFVQVQPIPCDSSVQPKVAAAGAGHNANTLQGAASVSTLEERGVMFKDTSQVGQSDGMGSVNNVHVPGVQSSSFLGQLGIGNGESADHLIIEGRPEENSLAVDLLHDHQNRDIDQERFEERKLDLDPSEKQAVSDCERTKSLIPDISFQSSDQLFCPANIENDASLSLKDESPSVSLYLSFSGEVDVARDGVHASNSYDEVMESVPDALSDMGSPESLHVLGAQNSSGGALLDQIASKAVVKNIGTDHGENLAVGGGSSASAGFAITSISHENLVGYSSDNALEKSCSARDKTVSFPSNGSRSMNCGSDPLSTEPYGRLNRHSHMIRRAFPSHSSFTATTSKITSNSTAKPNTWCRTSSSSAASPGLKPSLGTLPAKLPLPGKNAKLQNTSYIRKGNSLVRKPVAAIPQTQLSHSTVPVHRSNSSDVHDLKKSTVSANTDDVNGMPNHLRTGGRNHLARPQTPPLSVSDNLPNCNIVPSARLPSSQAANPSVTGSSHPVSDPMGCTENDVLKTHEDAGMTSEAHQDQTASMNSSGSQNEMEDESLATSKLKRITYVKCKSNQLVAKVNDFDLPICMVDKKQGLPSEGYYKRKRNQLIRTSLDSAKQSSSDNADTEGQLGANIVTSASSGRRRSLKGASKLQTPLKSALVWTLRGTSGNFNASNHHKFFPQFFPWKRATYWRYFMRNSVSIGDNRSLSAISRRLMLLRKRDTVYVRSSHGLSLRKSKVVSVGGRSLKWSKSIESQSKKASEEATRAVAAVEKKKREQNGAASLASVTKNKSQSLRERIFRVGNERYKMDASRKTLIRISDDESSLTAASQQGTNAKKSYVPRRLVIGNDEYVRIGNGNQLIRDPKKRTRVLANEKVKWSLHTARLKLAKKRTYCQFFTRFGKCNKGDGRCPYIHDPSKIAVCTKFLTGSCSNNDCKLTHEVIPERMPDCSYFLQGLCTNKNCPYRHVNVNPNSSTCEGFLRGYCADGNECRKKHSYVCPIFESTGNCPLGSKCKLHHPKSRTKGKKRKRSKEKKNAMGRYFGGSKYVRASDPGTSVTEKPSADESNSNNGDDNPFEEKLADYVSLDVSDEEEGAEDIGRVMGVEANDDFDMELDDLDELIKPIGIMNVMA
ncbi:uncharacterized protein LOC116187720 isoform X1 [Punica granatum]|uniref:Uncharacterized protein LOC116187720 isoform X1 n=1 Tax=Punica granatum TaxID=22663 RepID=A0A6P8BQ78_PUNGR|nr:uncharacterized protein LOC116187720 isoform X1 [Punica granatum]